MNQLSSETILVQFILHKFDEMTEVVRRLDDDVANSTLQAPGSNSAVQILVHCCGMMRRWSSTVNLGVPIARDRDSEFQAEMSVSDVLDLAKRTREQFICDTRQTQMQEPPQAVPSSREHFWTCTAEGVLLHVLEEIAQHLGQMQVTVDTVFSDES